MTIFFPTPSSPLLIRRRDATCSERKGASGIPFCPPSWKQLENGCGMLGRRQRERARKSSSSRASERASGKTKIDAFKVFPYPPLSGRGGRERERGRRGKPLSAPVPSLPSSSTIPSTRKPTDQWRFKKIFQNFSPILSLRPPRNFKASPSFLPRLFYFPHLFSQLPPTFLEKTGEKQKSLP